jgi:hypothetical protein
MNKTTARMNGPTRLNRRCWLAAAAAALAAPQLSFAQSAVPKQFEAQMRRGARGLHDSQAVLKGEDGLWRKHWLAVDELQYDVIRTPSALRPLMGTLGVQLAVRTGSAHADRRSAEMVQTDAQATRFVRYDLWFQPETSHWSFVDGSAFSSPHARLEQDRQWWDVTAAGIRAGSTLDANIVAAFTNNAERSRRG